MNPILGASLLGRLLALPKYIRQGWKDLPGTNTLVFFQTLVNYGRKSYIILGTGANATKLFCGINLLKMFCKLELFIPLQQIASVYKMV